MPKVTIAEDHHTRTAEDQVRLSGKISCVELVPKSDAPQLLSQQQFRLRTA
jgi:hypothetical protein